MGWVDRGVFLELPHSRDSNDELIRWRISADRESMRRGDLKHWNFARWTIRMATMQMSPALRSMTLAVHLEFRQGLFGIRGIRWNQFFHFFGNSWNAPNKEYVPAFNAFTSLPCDQWATRVLQNVIGCPLLRDWLGSTLLDLSLADRGGWLCREIIVGWRLPKYVSQSFSNQSLIKLIKMYRRPKVIDCPWIGNYRGEAVRYQPQVRIQ